MTRKLISLLLCCLVAAGLLAGCAGEPAAPTTTAGTQAASASEPVLEGTEYTLAPERGTNQLTFYWKGGGVDYSKCDMWIWMPGADGRGYPFHPCAYGGKVVLNVPEDVTEVGFIVRRDCSDPGGTSWGEATKDYDADRFAVITGPETVIYLLPGDGGQYLSTDGGVTLTQTKLFSLAAITGMNQIQYFLSPATRITSLDQIRVLDGDRSLEITDLSSLNNEVILGTITLAEPLDFSKTYTVHIDGFEDQTAVPTTVFDSPEFVEQYTYDGDDLGAVISGDQTIFKVWAPTASAVRLNLFESGSGGDAVRQLDMVRGERGVWSAAADCGHGTYYTYSVTTAVGTQEAVDPYARAVGVNGDRGMVVDLAQTDPEGWAADRWYDGIEAYNQAVIWEVHVRDFSNKIAGSRYPGKYLAFTETGLKNADGQAVGVDYLRELGVTHVHFQPLYDYATVDESSGAAQFNWGYDPKNYNAPEGSYSTDPDHGEVRIRELKQMVQALHENGMGVVMDVVYNHTYSLDSNLNRIVPYYYYRFTGTGDASNGSGCGNETASERVMFRKYMVDSVSYWAKEYHIDGFRFDLMALHDVQTMQAVEAAVHAANPKAILYGEGWTGGTTTLNANLQASQANIRQITANGIGAISVFNDMIRDGLKGSVFSQTDRAYVNGKADKGTAERVIFGLIGGEKTSAANWFVENNQVINYTSCHDNQTLWDKLLASNPEDSDEARFAMNRLAAEVVLIGKGTPFFLAGEEMLRTKQGDSNSYNSSDEINNLDWESLTAGSLQLEMHDLYRDLIAMRRANAFFTQAELTCTVTDDFGIEVLWQADGRTVAAARINPAEEAVSWALPDGDWGLLLDGTQVDLDAAQTVSGTQTVPGKSVVIAVAGN